MHVDELFRQNVPVLQISLPASSLQQSRNDPGPHQIAIGRRYDVLYPEIMHLVGRYAEHLPARFVEEDHLPVERGQIDELARAVHDGAELLELLLRRPSLRYILGGADDGDRLSVAHDRRLVDLEPHPAAVLGDELGLVRRLALAGIDGFLREFDSALVHRMVGNEIGPSNERFLRLVAEDLLDLGAQVGEKMVA